MMEILMHDLFHMIWATTRQSASREDIQADLEVVMYYSLCIISIEWLKTVVCYRRMVYITTLSFQQTCILTMTSMLYSLLHAPLFIQYLFISFLSWPKMWKYNVLNMLNQNVTKSIPYNAMHVTHWCHKIWNNMRFLVLKVIIKCMVLSVPCT